MMEQKGAQVIDLMAALKASLATKMDELHESALREDRECDCGFGPSERCRSCRQKDTAERRGVR